MRIHLFPLFSFLALLASSLSAATISWSTSAVSGPGDVRKDGALVGAMNVGTTTADGVPTQVVNGVPFESEPGGAGALALGSATVQFSFANNLFHDFWVLAAPGGSAEYDRALDYGRSQDGGTRSGTVTLGGLVVGRSYLVQLWVADRRSCCDTRDCTVDGVATNAVTANIITGAFTADAASQVITIVGVGGTDHGPQVNMLQLRETARPPLVVTSAGDADAGSLREALAAAAAQAGADTIVFDAALNGQTIALSTFTSTDKGNTAFDITDIPGVTVDATSLPAGIKIDGGLQGFRIFRLRHGASVTLNGLTLSRGGGATIPSGGAIDNEGGLKLTRCTLFGNQAGAGGALNTGNQGAGLAVVVHCTFVGNSASNTGGGINSTSVLYVTHCTFSGNSATNSGGGGYVSGATTLANSIFTGNTAASGADLRSTGTTTRIGVSIVPSSVGNVRGSGSFITTVPALASLGSYGGTPSLPPLPGSIAIDAASAAAGLTTDQRGAPRGTAVWSHDFYSSNLAGGEARGSGTVYQETFRLTGSAQGSLVLPDLDSLSSFTASFDYTFNSLGGVPKDGICLGFGPDPGGVIDSTGNGTAHVVRFGISVDSASQYGEISYRKNGTLVTSNITALNHTTDAGIVQPITVTLTSGGLLTVKYKGTTVLDAVQTGYIYAPGDRIFFGATSQFGNADQRVDNVGVLTEPVGVPDIGAVEAFSGPVNAVVTSNADAGPGTLRNILAAVPTGSTITFDPAVFAGAAAGANTIALTTSASLTALNIPANKAVTIDATAIPAGVKLDGGSQGFRLFTVNTGASLALHGLTLTRGGGESFTGNGGAILNSGTLTVTRSTLSGNRTDGTGGRGGALYNTATASITACTFSGNSADQSGGAIYTLAPVGTLTLTQCTVAGNTSAAGSGGGMRSGGGRLNLAHCTISGNTAPTTGNGGIFIGGDGSTITRVQNCIIARNTTRDVENLSDAYVPFTSLGHNIVGTGSAVAEFNAAGDIINNAPQLAALANNGGPTQTHALLANSPARNAAAELVPAITSDQRGFAIVGVPDIGAFEFPNTVPIAPNGAATATTGDSKTITLPATDADNHTLTIISTTPDSHLTVNSTSGVDVTFTPATNFVGDATLGYTVSDGNGGTASGTITVTITDNDAPTISGIFTPRIVSAGVMPDFRNQAVVSDNVSTPTVTQSALQGSVTTPGDVAMLLTATDAAGLTATINFTVSVRPLAAVHTIPFIIDGDNTPLAPGTGTNGLPADAKLTSFNQPAIDEVGDVAFVAKWKSATSRGSGLFLNERCLAIVGGPSPVAGAKYVSFTDPVLDGGTVVCIAKLSNGESAVVSNFTGAELEKIAMTGEVAADADDAKYKSFKTVAVRGGSLCFLGKLTGGTGANKITAANDDAAWTLEPGTPLHYDWREGFNFGFKDSFVTFQPGIGSPGQGRWFSHNQRGFLTLIDKSRYLVATLSNIYLALAGDVGTNAAPALAGASFASFRYPAMNDALQNTFYATMNVGTGGVTKANASGIFLGNADFTGSLAPYELVARVGAPTGFDTGKFSKLSDPVLSANGGIAFTATQKGIGIKGLTTKLLCWKPAGQSLGLLALGGNPAGDVPDSQWKSFDSLAITDRGPIFAAKLVVGKGGVTAKTASGVWACDFNGNPRKLFRTGDTINGKKLAKFTVLKATVGNLGVTRSFNNNAQVVWLATFTDKSSAIIVTTVP